MELDELLGALSDILKRAELAQAHQISREVLSTRERMLKIMEQLSQDGESGRYTPFEALFTLEEGRAGVVVTFMAILELAKEAMIEIVQNAPLSPIHVRARQAALVDGEEDAFELDDAVSMYLPQFANQRVFTDARNASMDATKSRTTEMTVEHLLLHTSGMGSRSSGIYRQQGVRLRSITLEQMVDAEQNVLGPEPQVGPRHAEE